MNNSNQSWAILHELSNMKLRMASTTGQKKQCVLYIENERNDILLFSRLLAESNFEGSLRVVSSVQEAQDYFAREGRFFDPEEYPEPDLIVSEMNLPGPSGNDFASWLRAQKCFDGIPLVFFSRDFPSAEKARAEELGVAGLVMKTSDPKLFAERLSAVLKFLPKQAQEARTPMTVF